MLGSSFRSMDKGCPMPPEAPTTATLAAVALVEEKERAAAMAAGRRAVRAASMIGLWQ